MPGKILCVAEKPSIAKAVAEHLGGGQVTMVCITCSAYFLLLRFPKTIQLIISFAEQYSYAVDQEL